MKIYTKTGDDGTTSLFHGGRVKKHDLRVEAYGCVDELNSYFGVIASFCESHQEIKEWVLSLQSKLFVLGSDLATPLEANVKKVLRISNEDVKQLEEMIDKMDSVLPPLQSFILPGGSVLSSFIHVARAACRRCERRVTELGEQEKINQEDVKFLNRLSDLLFVLARYVNYLEGVLDIPWEQKQEE